MFILAVIFAIIAGYILKGKIRNLENVEIGGLYFAFAAFLIELFIIILIKRGVLFQGIITLVLNFIMYSMLFVFTYINRKNKFLLIMGVGFLLNAIPIFANGGAMPVGIEAIKATGLTMDVAKEGLYSIIDENTRFWFLGDIFPLIFITRLAISAGDIISAIGLMMFIITGMKLVNVTSVNKLI